MSPFRTPQDDSADDASALIRALRDADQNVLDMTGGEVDAVLDRDGRAFLLRGAQHEVRYEETARQAGLLNALPAHVALLDAGGVIVSVNDAWRRYAQANGLTSLNDAVGVNYLAVCDAASGPHAAEATQVAKGIRAVLAGESPSYSLEYPCHSPTQKRWFVLSVTPQGGRHLSGVALMHLEVTQRKLSEDAFWRFAATMDAIADAIFLVDRESMTFVHVNDAACRLHGLSREKLLATEPWAILPASRLELERIYDSVIASGVDPRPIELSRQLDDGSRRWLELRRHAQSVEGRWSIITLVRDITERKEAEERIAYLNRVYAVLSGINTLIVRVRDQKVLFDEVCRIAVGLGGFKMIWIGLVDDSKLQIVPVASAGMDDEYLSAIKGRLAADATQPFGHSLAGTAVRDRRSVVSNATRKEPHLPLRRMHERYGIRSLAVLPLIIADRAVGTMSLYTDEANFFHDGEMKLLTELAGDISFAIDHIEKQKRLDHLAYYDVLTGLANRSLFVERLQQYMHSAVSAGFKLAVFVIDLERFKNINESLGRSAGDVLLRQAADCLKRLAGDGSLLTRLDSDHFAVVMPELKQDDPVGPRLEHLMEGLINCPFRLDDAVFRIGAKAGAAIFPEDGADADTLIKSAEAALKSAKTSGERYEFYTAKMTGVAARRLTLENKLRQAIDQEQFVLHYQPKVRLVDGKMVGAEALIRWNDPIEGLVPPGRFIPILEETGLISEVGRWALRKSVEDHRRWVSAGLAAVRIAVNVSPLQLRNRGFVSHIQETILVHGDAAQGLELEITESLVMEDVKNSIASLQAIRNMGVAISIDDFGTGFSSLNYLAKLPVDTIKIDRSFIADMTDGPQGMALVSAIINLAHSLDLKVVAEGVETDEQSRLLRLLNCNEAQGYLFSKPLPVEIFEERYLKAVAVQARQT